MPSDSDLYFRALELSRAVKESPSALERLSRSTSGDAARWAFEQWSLRERAKVKFARAEELLFTRGALEMATHERVASWRAGRFPSGALVQDLTCGIGGDLMALARRGPVEGYETDPETAKCAKHNLSLVGGTWSVRESDGVLAVLGDYAFADPARRKGHRRTLDPADFVPDPRILAAKFRGISLGAIKLSPMLPDEYLNGLGPEITFVSHRGECCEAVVWQGSQARPGCRAVHVDSGEEVAASEMYGQGDEPGEWLYEADPAAIRARALGSLGSGLLHLGDARGYLTADLPVPTTVWLRAYRVRWRGAYRPEKINLALRQLSARVEVVKKRGVPIDPQSVRLKPAGDHKLVLVLFPVGPKVRAALVEPADPPVSTRQS